MYLFLHLGGQESLDSSKDQCCSRSKCKSSLFGDKMQPPGHLVTPLSLEKCTILRPGCTTGLRYSFIDTNSEYLRFCSSKQSLFGDLWRANAVSVLKFCVQRWVFECTKMIHVISGKLTNIYHITLF